MLVVGIDEVGRGCWAGPVAAGAVLLNIPIDGLQDSKALSPRRRQALAELINETATYGIGWASEQEVDELGLTAAVGAAMHRAYEKLGVAADDIIIDGSYNFLANVANSRAVIKADGSVPEVSAASIIAKVARDQYMLEQSMLYPRYGFERHVGYGTALHRQALVEYGVCKIHRMSYKPIRAILGL